MRSFDRNQGQVSPAEETDDDALSVEIESRAIFTRRTSNTSTSIATPPSLDGISAFGR